MRLFEGVRAYGSKPRRTRRGIATELPRDGAKAPRSRAKLAASRLMQ